MVIYDLCCKAGHRFEAWFKNAEAFDAQSKKGLIQCAHCGTPNVTRIPSGAHVGAAARVKAKKALPSPTTSPTQPKDQHNGNQPDPVVFLKALRTFVNKNFKDVGNQFTEVAIDMHKGDLPPAPVRGTANKEQCERLSEEGVSFLPIPELPESFEN